MIGYEINQAIAQLQSSLISVQKRMVDAEKNISQLMSLRHSCDDYQSEFASAQTIRKTNLNNFNEITGQPTLIGAYGGMLAELLDGAEYIGAYGSMNTAKEEIDREIERQRLIISSCSQEISRINSNINNCRQQTTGTI